MNNYIIKRARVKHFYIRIKDGKVEVKVPENATDEAIKKVLKEKQNWILKKLEEQERNIKKEKRYESGEIFRILGKDYKLKIEISELEKAELILEEFEIKIRIKKENNEIIKNLIDKMYLMIAIKRTGKIIEKYSKIMGLYPKNVEIKESKMAWGKCDSRKRIVINPRLFSFDGEIVEYVIVHELAHLKHMNHSKAFWSLVEKYIPNYKELRKKLKNS